MLDRVVLLLLSQLQLVNHPSPRLNHDKLKDLSPQNI